MTDETPGLEPAEAATPAPDAPAPVDSATTPTENDTPDDSGQTTEEPERDERGRFTGAQKRIDELTRNWREAERREAQLLAMLQQQREQAAPPPPPAEAPKLPTLEEYGYDEAKYQTALLTYATKQAEYVVEQKLSAARQQEAQQKRMSSFAERQTAFAKATPDYEDLVLRDMSLPITDAMRDVIVDSEQGPEVAYHLAKNREVAERIARLPAHLAARELGRIEARLEAAKEAAKRPTVPPVSKAPPPPPTVEAVDVEVEKDPDSMTMKEWLKWRNKDLRKSAPPWARK